ncbi:uncharacterized protein LOC142324205 [Lycorma delicatula]|uniref:uncharacterized protein LOC142324205 n=1 Tax=Lycorma delicatula TaxID=130591 RepID=UPI003F517D31
MSSKLSFVVLYAYLAVIIAAHEEETSGSTQNSQMVPQVYIKDSSPASIPIKTADVNNQQHTSTTVCIEMRSGPSSAYTTICGPQVPPGIVQPAQYFPYPNGRGDLIKISVPGQQQSQQMQPMPSEMQPFIVNPRGMIIQQQPMPFLQPMSPLQSQTQLYSNPKINQQNVMNSKQFYGSQNSNQLATDGTLSMNCHVGGLKYLNVPDSLNTISLGYRLPQTNSFKSIPLMNMYNNQPQPLNFGMNPLLNNFQDSSGSQSYMRNSEPSNSKTWKNIHDLSLQNHDIMSNEQQMQVIGNDKLVQENKKKLDELKKQIASLQENASSPQRASPNDSSQNSPQQNQTPPQQPPTQQIQNHSSSQMNTEVKQAKPTPNANQHFGRTHLMKEHNH